MPLVATRGAASAQGFGEFAVTSTPTYIEDVFSCFLYTGTGASQTITNNIDLSTKGGLTWIKGRSGATGHRLTDTARGATKSLASETSDAEATESTGLTAFGTTGFTIGADADYNTSAATYVSWTSRKQPKFFDVVTWTGSGSNTTIAHNLGSVPGSIIVKRTDTTADWAVYHRSLANTQYLVLNDTAAAATGATWWNSTTPTSAVFSVGTNASVNASGGTYVAYIFAHNAGGFGLTSTDNVISCGSFTTSSYAATVNLGYEPQWLLVKSSANTGDWFVIDNMRGLTNGSGANFLYPNLSDAETVSGSNAIKLLSTGFSLDVGYSPWNGNATDTYIYIAIRRGPMKVPTSGTSVFAPVALPSPGANPNTLLRTTNFPVDFYLAAVRNQSFNKFAVGSRLQGKDAYLSTNLINQENAYGDLVDNLWDNNTGLAIVDTNCSWNGNDVTQTTILEAFRRAPGFFDEVCYTGTGSNTTITHNLGAVPELMINKRRSGTLNWYVYVAPLGNDSGLWLNTTTAVRTGDDYWNSTTPTSSVFSIGAGNTNLSGSTYVQYLFSTLAGVSKVGSYTGTGTTKQIDCGFTGGARFVLIKRTDSTGDWYVWDTARGIVSGDDPYLLLNSAAAEVTNTDYIDTYSAGFEISSTAPAAINNSGGTFIFLAIA